MIRFNKKGDWISYMFAAVVIFMLGIVIIIGKLAVNEVTIDLNASSELGNESKEIMNTFNANYIGLWDNLFATIFIGLFLAMCISAYFIRSHPIYYFIFIVIIAVFSLINMLLADFFHELMSNAELSVYANEFSKMAWFMGTKFPFFMLIFGILLGIIFYSKGGQQ